MSTVGMKDQAKGGKLVRKAKVYLHIWSSYARQNDYLTVEYQTGTGTVSGRFELHADFVYWLIIEFQIEITLGKSDGFDKIVSPKKKDQNKIEMEAPTQVELKAW